MGAQRDRLFNAGGIVTHTRLTLCSEDVELLINGLEGQWPEHLSDDENERSRRLLVRLFRALDRLD